ncbi:MAG: phosphoribosylformylglycinamidine synthase subunit PurL [Solirubrobacterales bacterium]|nr:phosphoribosylformylglycinamidine synthase subunit PurL [Solirubrobacterales bacterium]HMT04455.1 phosphoribosylformylglycinamidine synthase subunit PurL [Solirubrobacterales bacterium]
MSEQSAHRALGLTDQEFELICGKMGREPNGVELAMFSLLWSEHCAYKHSRKLLKNLPTEGPRVVMGPGENAGAVDIGNGYSIAFKVESHNHPSAVEPFQGAATGVGGILRDVIALGARPIAILDSLRFGEPDTERTHYLVDGVVRGIGHYGNCMGIPTVGGEIYFEPPYEQNPLVNAMCVGIARTDEMVRAAAAGTGNKVVLFGSLTGRDGIGGASVLASAELDEGDDAKRPTVQIGDPFEESKLLECCQELLAGDLLVSLQDLGAAGLTSSAGEMASAGGTGIDIDVGLVPLREADMEPFEIMVSESQERMLAVVEPGKVDAVLALCAKWQTRSAVIGEITDTGTFRILRNGDTAGEIEVEDLVDGCPLYDLDPEEPADWTYPNRESIEPDASPSDIALSLLAAPSIASKRWAFEQYDSVVGSRTVHRAGAADAAVLSIPESGRAIAVAIDGNGRRVACDPYQGTVEATLECASNLAVVGAEPLGVTNCLNFGNPEKPGVAWQLGRAIDGLAEACRALEAPVVGGNVSLYNETPQGPIYPTPVVGMVGELPDPGNVAGGNWREGDSIALVGPFDPSLAGSELEKQRGQLGKGLPEVEIAPVRAAIELVRDAVRGGVVRTATDVSDGGITTALAELAISSGVGCEADLAPIIARRSDNPEDALFGEGPGGFILAGDMAELEKLGGQGVDIELIGEVTGNEIIITANGNRVEILVEEAEAAFDSLEDRIESDQAGLTH